MKKTGFEKTGLCAYVLGAVKEDTLQNGKNHTLKQGMKKPDSISQGIPALSMSAPY